MHFHSHELLALRHVVTRHTVPGAAPAPSVPKRRRHASAIVHALVAVMATAIARLA